MYQKIALLLIFVCSFSNSKAQGGCGVMLPQDSSNWGIGFIVLKKDKWITGENKQTNTKFLIGQNFIKLNNNSTMPFHSDDIVLAWDNTFLKVSEIKNTSYRVLDNSIEGGVWLEFNELDEQQLQFSTYYSILFNGQNKNSNIGYLTLHSGLGINLFNSCLYLRTENSVNGKIVTCLKNNIDTENHFRLSILNHKNEWAYVIAAEFGYDPENEGDYGEGCAFKLVKEYRGWVKAIDDNGRPNIWYGISWDR